MTKRSEFRIPNSAFSLLAIPEPLHFVMPQFNAVNLVLVGCGGTGSHLASGLGALACELRERGASTGSAVALTFVDPDRVEPKNVGRQLFTRADIGRNKAHALAERIAAAYGVPVTVFDTPAQELDIAFAKNALNLIIGAVDNHSARRVLHDSVAGADGKLFWLDAGNENHSGQIVLGNVVDARKFKHSVEMGMLGALPAASLVYPEIIKAPKRPNGHAARNASCAELTAAGEQSLMINRLVAAWALSLLYDFLLARDVKYFALAFNAQTGGTRTYPLDLPTLCEVTGLRANELNGKQK